MRQIATIPDGDAARTLADHLLTLKIETRVLPEDGGWALWVCDEDKLTEAKEELATFLKNPTDARYAGAAQAAQAERDREAREEKAYQKRNVDLAQRWGDGAGLGRPYLTLALALISIAVSVGSGSVFVGLTDKPLDVNNRVLQAVLIKSLSDRELSQRGLGQVAHGEWWRLVTPIFVHFGPIHLLFNLWMLRDLGAAVEIRRGTWRYLLLALVLAMASNVGQYFLGDAKWHGSSLALDPHPNPLFGGLSGVLYGLFGYAWMKSRLAPEIGLFVHPNTVVMMLGWFVLCLTDTIGPVANVAHGVGLILGIIIGATPHLLKR